MVLRRREDLTCIREYCTTVPLSRLLEIEALSPRYKQLLEDRPDVWESAGHNVGFHGGLKSLATRQRAKVAYGCQCSVRPPASTSPRIQSLNPRRFHRDAALRSLTRSLPLEFWSARIALAECECGEERNRRGVLTKYSPGSYLSNPFGPRRILSRRSSSTAPP